MYDEHLNDNIENSKKRKATTEINNDNIKKFKTF
jgi:hypothetical protein